MERDAVGAGVDRVGDIARRGSSEPVEQRRHRRRVRRRQPRQADLLGQPPGEQPGSPRAHRGAREELVAPVRADDQQALVGDAAGQRLEDLERQVVAPVQVLEREDDRTVGGQAGQDLGDVQDEQPAAALGIAATRRRRSSRASASSRRLAEPGPDVGQRPAGAAWRARRR